MHINVKFNKFVDSYSNLLKNAFLYKMQYPYEFTNFTNLFGRPDEAWILYWSRFGDT